MLPTQSPIKMFRGTLAEVLSHRSEVPAEAIVELCVYQPIPKTIDETGAFGGRSLADVFREIGGIDNLPSDMSEDPKKYMINGKTPFEVLPG